MTDVRFPGRTGDVFCDQHGFTTVGMAVALLVTLSLLFTTAQVYRVTSASAEVQDVADACALAAENQVAEFMLVARTCDAVVLSLSLTGIAATGLGVAALCTPATAAWSADLITAGKSVFALRDSFSQRAGLLLGKLQEALPFYAAAVAAGVATQNDGGPFGASYVAVAVLVPWQGAQVDLSVQDDAAYLADEVEGQADEIRAKAAEAEQAAQEADRAKQRAFDRDCGDAPGYCMYERAGHLAGLQGLDNPLYSSVDAWSFAVPLARAQAYYAARLALEAPANASLEEQARSALRARFYRYAAELLATGYVVEPEGSYEAYLPHLPSNTQEMRLTSLYEDEVYPVTFGEDELPTVHAWAGCPEAAGSLERWSIRHMEQVDHGTCPVCGFTAASMGNVASASTSIANGFEYHYEAVADEAFLYTQARRKADVPASEVRERAGGLLDKLGDLAATAAGRRIDLQPPGRYGVVAFVVNAASTPADAGFTSGFVAGGRSLGPRAAIAAATLLDEGSEEGRNAVSALLDGLGDDAGLAAGAAGAVLRCWAWALAAYADGQDALIGALEDGLGSLPLMGSSGLGAWAAGALRDALSDVGLQPAQVGALKPVLVNSAHVAGKDGGSLSQGLLSVKQAAVSHPSASTDLFGALLAGIEQEALDGIDSWNGSIEVASIELEGEDGAGIPLSIPLPPAARDVSADLVQALVARVRSFYADVSGVRVWQ